MKQILIKLALVLTLFSSAHTQTVDSLKFGPKKESLGKPLDKIVAIAGNDVITESELNRMDQDSDRNVILQQLITKSLLLQAAKKSNITVDDTAVNLAVEDYAKKLNVSIDQLSKSKNYADLRQNIKDSLVVNRLQQSVASHFVKITDQEIDDAMEKQLSQVTDSAHLVDLLITVPQTNDPEILQKAQTRTEQVINELKSSTPEQVADLYPDVIYHDLGWVELSQIPAKFTEGLMDVNAGQYAKPIIDKDGIHLLRVVERQNKGQKQVAITKETKASHILIRTKGNPNAMQDIEKVEALLKKGKDFAELAELYSQDTGSAAKGGDLGWVSPGQMVPEFEAAMNNVGIGQISKPIRSNFGWHIIKVFDRREIKSKNQEMLKQSARRTLFQRKASQEWEIWLTQLRDESYVKIIK